MFLCTYGRLGIAQSAASLDDIMRSAKDNGLQVIVISPDGSTAAEASQSEGTFQDSFMMTSQERLSAFRVTLRERLRAAPASLEEVVFILNGQSPTGSYTEYFYILGWTLLLFLVSELIVRETWGKRLVGPWFERLLSDRPEGYTEKLPVLLLRGVLAVVGLMLVTFLAYVIGYTIFGEADDGTVRLTVAYIYLSYVTARLVVFLWRMILSPYLSPYRIPAFSDRDAIKLYWWLLSVATISVIVINFTAWIEELGVSYNVHAVISSVLTFVVVLLNIVMVLVNREGITGAILHGEPYEKVSVLSRFAARSWAPGVIVYFLVAWAEMSYRLIEQLPLGAPLITGFYLILLTVIVVYGVVGYMIERIFRRRRAWEAYQARRAEEEAAAATEEAADGDQVFSEDREAAEPDEDAADDQEAFPNTNSMTTFEDLSRRVATILAVGAGLWAITQIWQIDIGMVASDEGSLSTLYDILAILVIGYVIYHAARIWIDQKIEEEGGDQVEVAPGDEGGAGGATRLATLLPLFRMFLLSVIVIAFGMIALTNLGINISALFAGAGIVGLAIGFGAQTLVRDIFSGAFFLFDDAFRKGEYIDVGAVRGTVEKISVRSFQLRHHLGPLHTIPFGEIQQLTNFSRDWVMMKLPLRVTYDTDVEKVRKLIKKLGQKLAEDELIGHQFLQPLKSQGVIEMQDSAMIIRVKFMTKPGDQWVLRKRVYQEIRDLFEREGIKFAHREVTVRLAGANEKDLSDEQKKAVGAAALSSLDDDALDDMMDNDAGGDDR